MGKSHTTFTILVTVLTLNYFLNEGDCRKYRRLHLGPGDPRAGNTKPKPTQKPLSLISQDVDFEVFRDSKWSGTVDPEPETGVDFIDCDDEWDDLMEQQSVKFRLDKESCELNILGSKAEKCSAEIVCTDLNFKDAVGNKCREDSYLKITDALGGSLTACGSGNFGGPYRASKNGRDLYIKYKGPSNGTICKVICGSNRYIPHCGIKPEMQGRVVGGKDAHPFEFPWLVAIAHKSTRKHFCGGSLINDRYILTAAHCFRGSDTLPGDIDILLHAHILNLNLNDNFKAGAPAGSPGSILQVPGLNEKNFTDAEEETLRLEVESIHLHPLWEVNTLDYDLCLIKLKKPLNLNNTRLYNPICLPPEGKYFGYADKIGIVAGWGKPHEDAGAASRTLQKAKMPVLFSKKCRRLFDPETRNMTPRMFCAGHVKGGIDSCGDSGGPLIFKFNDDQYRQIGIVSFGTGCARPANPGVYTHVQAVDAIWCENLLKNTTKTKRVYKPTPPPDSEEWVVMTSESYKETTTPKTINARSTFKLTKSADKPQLTVKLSTQIPKTASSSKNNTLAKLTKFEKNTEKPNLINIIEKSKTGKSSGKPEIG